jgi:hypothetical protein
VTNVSEKERIVEYEGQLVQQINPVFLDPRAEGILDYRAHFFAPTKNLLGNQVSTYWFNVMMIWIMTIILYITLYLEWMKKLVEMFENISGKVGRKKMTMPKKE